jgi:hypothetical protein
LILFIPFKYFVDIKTGDNACVELRFRSFFINVYKISYNFDKKSKKEHKIKKKSKSKSEKKVKLKDKILANIELLDEAKENNKLSITDIKELIYIIKKFLLELIRSLNINNITVTGELGLKEPHQTGYVCVCECFAYYISNNKFNSQIKYNFDNQILNLSFKLDGQIILFCFLLVVIRNVLSRNVFRVLKIFFSN